MRVALFPGSFDPVTLGHVDIINRGLLVFDKIVIGVGTNADKKYMYPRETRELWIRQTFANETRVEVKSYEGLTVEFCKKVNATFILRGLRNAADFEFEKAIAHMNSGIAPGVETVFVLSSLQFGALSSSIIRDIIRNGGNASQYLPAAVTF
jgi:pantetheine-phosphate adenylyltransferase